MLAWVAAHQFLLIGMVCMLVIGPAVGNYACSVVYRLPRGKTPFERYPFCGHCNADLKPIDLFPILSWLSTRGKCRYCAGPVPGSYTLIELACAIFFVGYFLKFGVSEYFLLAATYGVFVTILAAIQWQQGWVSASVLGYILTAVALARTLAEGTIYGWVQGAAVMLVLCLTVLKLATRITRSDFKPTEAAWVWWMVLLGALVPMPQWLLLSVPVFTLLVFRFANRPLRPLVIFPITALALYLPVLVFPATL